MKSCPLIRESRAGSRSPWYGRVCDVPSRRPARALAESITTSLQAPNQHQCAATFLDSCMNLGGMRTFGVSGWFAPHLRCANGTARTVWRREGWGGGPFCLAPTRSNEHQVAAGMKIEIKDMISQRCHLPPTYSHQAVRPKPAISPQRLGVFLHNPPLLGTHKSALQK